jgi:hypothetical protein
MFKGASNPVVLKLESQPPGADAKTSLGPGCRTPCAVTITASADFTVTFALEGYQPQTVSVEVMRDGARSDPKVTPNPAYAALEAIAPPEKPKPAPAKKKPRVASKPAPADAGQASATGFPPAPAATAPWPR